MQKIKVLDKQVSNMIAAGEVVSRPSSVVKELVENSIDAGATVITVEIKNGGSAYIRVTDNGQGIGGEDASLVFLRHATSKITTAHDLATIRTMGFRGEALASIASVSKVELTTKDQSSYSGTALRVVAGEIVSKQEIGCPIGTTFVVRDLFFNTPARMKFLKQDTTEAAHIKDIVDKLVLGNPHISFRFINNGRETLVTAGDNTMKSCVFSVYGKECATNSVKVQYSDGGVEVRGVVGNPSLSRPNRNFQAAFVNGRYIKNKTISLAVEEAFHGQITGGCFPFFALHVFLNPTLVDVNVHPAKTEVKFANEQQLYQAVYWAVKNSLHQAAHGDTGSAQPDFETKTRPAAQSSLDAATATVSQPSLDATTELAAHLGLDTAALETTQPTTPYPLPSNAPGFGAKDTSDMPYSSHTEPSQKGDSADLDPFDLNSEQSDASPHGLQSTVDHPPLNFTFDEPVVQPKANPDLPKLDALKIKHDKAGKKIDYNYFKLEDESDKILEKQEQQETLHQQKLDEAKKKEIIIVGIAFNTYILAEQGDNFLMIDQHAAHERIMYEKIVCARRRGEVFSQTLLTPEIVALSGVEHDTALINSEFLGKIGFAFEDFGNSEVIVRQIPLEVVGQNIKNVFIELVGLVLDCKNNLTTYDLERALYTMACKSAVRGNQRITIAEAEQLLCDLAAIPGANTCPHGRPITVTTPRSVLEKNFKRT